MGTNPDVQAKVQKEVDEVFGEGIRKIWRVKPISCKEKCV